MPGDNGIPWIVRDGDSWQVRVKHGRKTRTYRCESESLAERFAALLAQPTVEPPRRRAVRVPVDRIAQAERLAQAERESASIVVLSGQGARR